MKNIDYGYDRFETRDAVANRLEEEGASQEIIIKVRKGGKKY